MGLMELPERGKPYRISFRGGDVTHRPEKWAGDDLVEASAYDRLRAEVSRLREERDALAGQVRELKFQLENRL